MVLGVSAPVDKTGELLEGAAGLVLAGATGVGEGC